MKKEWNQPAVEELMIQETACYDYVYGSEDEFSGPEGGGFDCGFPGSFPGSFPGGGRPGGGYPGGGRPGGGRPGGGRHDGGHDQFAGHC